MHSAKLAIRILLNLLVYSIVGNAIVAQESQLTTRAEIEKRLEVATVKGRGRPYRLKESFSEYLGSESNKPKYVSISIFEYQSSDHARVVGEVDEKKTIEIIQIGKMCYSRYEASPWKVDSVCLPNPELKLIGELPEMPGVDGKHEFRGEVIFNGIRTNLFVTIRQSENKGKRKDLKHLMVNSYWFDKDGFLVGQQNIWTLTRGSMLEFRREKTFEYQYNPKDLKIEAPIK